MRWPSAPPEIPDELSFDQIIGGVYSAMPADELPGPDHRAAFTERVRQALGPRTSFAEDIRVSVLVGQDR